MKQGFSFPAALKNYRGRRFCLAIVLVCLPVALSQATETVSVTLVMETQALDLDTGAVLDTDIGIPTEPTGEDVTFAYNADRTPHAVVFPVAEGVTLAFVYDMAFDGVTPESVADLTFSSEPVDAPFSASDTVVVRTSEGAVFKLGNAIESGLSLTFNYAQLQ
jgi:hypothetical protein